MTSVHVPFDTRIFHKECRALAEAGHEVHLVARAECDEVVDGVHIHAVRKFPGKLSRILSSPGEVKRTALALDCEIYHFHDPELLPAGIEFVRRGKSVVYDAHEDYPDYFRRRRDYPALVRLPASIMIGALERYSARVFDAVVTPTPVIEERFRQLGARTVLVRNYPFSADLVMDDSLDTVRTNELVYVGALTFDRGVAEMVGTAALAAETVDVRLRMAGDFACPEDEAAMRNLPGFAVADYLGRTTREETNALYAQAAIGLILFHPLSHYMNGYPTKLFEYMAAGLPVIASDFPLWRPIFEETGCGVLVDSSNIRAVADAVVALLNDPDKAREMGRRGREAVAARYNWEREKPALLSLYESFGR